MNEQREKSSHFFSHPKLLVSAVALFVTGCLAFGSWRPRRRAQSAEETFRARWPHLWSLLNRAAQAKLPKGLREYISGDFATTGEEHLSRIELLVVEMIRLLGFKAVGDVYRSDLSGFTSEQQVAEFACELSLCTALSRIATSTTLRPEIKGQQKRPDAKVELLGYEMFVEVKRFSDRGPGPKGRSIALRNAAGLAAKPRMMALASKINPVPAQLPDGAINVLFVFHSGYGENQAYIQQTLFGDKSFFDASAAVTMGDNALFAKKAWTNVSAVAYVSINSTGVLRCHELWQNPNASVALPHDVQALIRNVK